MILITQDEVPEPTDTTRVTGELTQWRCNFHTNASLENSSRGPSDPENTLVTNFRTSIRERSSDSSEFSSRPSSAQLLVGAATGGPNVSPPSNLQIAPLDLAGVGGIPATSLGSSTRSSSMTSSMSISEHSQRITSFRGSRKKSLKYAGKRVIMALRVKKLMPGEEKLEMIRLLLLKHAAKLKTRRQLTRGMSSPRQLGTNNQVSELDLTFPAEKSTHE